MSARVLRALRPITVAAFALLASASTIHAQTGSIAGHVRAVGTNEPLSGAQITVVGSQQRATSDETGSFRITGLSGSDVTLDSGTIETEGDYANGVEIMALGGDLSIYSDSVITHGDGAVGIAAFAGDMSFPSYGEGEYATLEGGNVFIDSGAVTTSRGAVERLRRASSSSRSGARSSSGPSGRGVESPSQAPHAQRAASACDAKASTSEDLPTPASPDTSTSRPRPASASSA